MTNLSIEIVIYGIAFIYKKDLGFNDPRSFKGSIVCVTFGLWCVNTDHFLLCEIGVREPVVSPTGSFVCVLVCVRERIQWILCV